MRYVWKVVIAALITWFLLAAGLWIVESRSEELLPPWDRVKQIAQDNGTYVPGYPVKAYVLLVPTCHAFEKVTFLVGDNGGVGLAIWHHNVGELMTAYSREREVYYQVFIGKDGENPRYTEMTAKDACDWAEAVLEALDRRNLL